MAAEETNLPTTNTLQMQRRARERLVTARSTASRKLRRAELADRGLVTIDAKGCSPRLLQIKLEAKADYHLAVKNNKLTLHAEIKSYFEADPNTKIPPAKSQKSTMAGSRPAPDVSPRSSIGGKPTMPFLTPFIFLKPPPSPSSTTGLRIRIK